MRQDLLAQLRMRWIRPGRYLRGGGEDDAEAEWEYAARAGTTVPRYGEVDDIAWYRDNSGRQPHPVRQKQPNAWGLYDMLGNVAEWCLDPWDYEPYPADVEPQVDPLGTDGSRRVCRGGSWRGFARFVRAAYRFAYEPDIRYHDLGLRLAGGRAPRSGGGAAEPRLPRVGAHPSRTINARRTRSRGNGIAWDWPPDLRMR